jgi:hypothetical protein
MKKNVLHQIREILHHSHIENDKGIFLKKQF